jgi:hypothetical protein
VTSAREHVRQLRAAGGTYEAIAAAAGVGAMTVHAIANSDVRVTPATTEALLAVSPAEVPHKRLDAGGTAWRLRSLMAMGHSQERMARALGTHPQTVYKLVSGEKTTVPADIRDAAASLWAAWWDKTPPGRTIAERAAAGATRNRAQAADWPAPMGLDEDEIDTPGYRPMTHFHPAQGRGVADDRTAQKRGRSMTRNAHAEPATLEPRAADPARSGAETAQQIITAQASAGMSTDRMARHHDDTAAWLWSDARTPDAERFAAGYASTADSLVAELREEERPEPDRSPGAPHPDPVLAGKGWQACERGDGVYVRRQAVAQADMEREAG